MFAFAIGCGVGAIAVLLILLVYLVVCERRAAEIVGDGDPGCSESVHLAAGESVHLTPYGGVSFTGPSVTTGAREISGLVIPWDTPGMTSLGQLVFARGSVQWPVDVSRVKLAIGHSGDDDHVPVAPASAIWQDDQGLWARFTIPPGPDGDRALELARTRVRDGLSAEVHGLKRVASQVTSGVMTLVAMVPVPAYADARVSLSAPSIERTTTVDPHTYYSDLIAAGSTPEAARDLVAQRFGVDAAASPRCTVS